MLRKLLVVTMLLSILTIGCKKDGDDNSTVIGAKVAEVLTVQSGAAAVYQENYKSTADTLVALNAMGQWIVDQDVVEKAYYVDLNNVEVFFKNGLHASILLTPTDANGQHLTRGGGYGSALKAYKSAASTKKIRNEKVLILNPFLKDFYNGHYDKAPRLKLDGQPMDVTVINNSDVTFEVLNTMDQYGFTIINTHGLTYGFIIYKFYEEAQNPEMKTWTEKEALDLLSLSGDVDLDKISNGEVELHINIEYNTIAPDVKQYIAMVVTTNYIRNSGLDLSDAVIFGNFCYSGYIYDGPGFHNVPEAFRSLNTATYYGYAFQSGYSAQVPDVFAKRMEDSLIANLANVADTTGAAHLANNTTPQFYDLYIRQSEKVLVERGTPLTPNSLLTAPLYFTKYYDGSYTYKSCGDTLLDSRDQQVYETVCIGNQVWMAENLNWAGAGVCYDGNNSNCDTYGRLYTINEVTNLDTSSANPSGVQGVCPNGWHVPSEAEFQELFDYCGGATQAAIKLRATTGWAQGGYTNSTGFNLLPSGHYTSDGTNSLYRYLGEAAYLWTSSAGPNQTYSAVNAYEPNLVIGTYSAPPTLTWKFSCRCVKD